ncbi:hypothetical protein [Melittangium boletus]|uniref:Uncharacterized protein n=1 Tax=Melittangium boletus DSM 14713 TaxID=1294270 RepID=A0A250IAE7_9BACT|nr:hypothetical protein [Melittangium boletus]ATB28107.1 hypothetical protein MEBOL_001552 [Melittangium boletus DSM 14713]
MSRLPLRLGLHLLATGAFMLLLPVVHWLHVKVFGRAPSRGVSVGVALQWVVLAHLVGNLIAALLPGRLLKGLGLVLFIAAALFLLLPQHPVRAAVLIPLGAALIGVALVLGRALERPLH